jgi:hypothetical protein
MAAKPKKLNVRIERMALADLRLLEENARFMKHETFQALVANLKRDGVLTQLPFAARTGDGAYEVLSGNHRVQAALEAGITESDVIVTDDKLTKQQRIAIQLSHNAIAGEDDPAVLKSLYEQLDTVDWRDYAGLDDKQLELLEKVDVDSLSEANLSFQTVMIAFLPHEAEEMAEAWDAARDDMAAKPDEVWVARLLEHEKLLNALDLVGRTYGVKNVAVALGAVLAVFRAHVTDLADATLEEWDEPRPGRENAWMPLVTILGKEDVPVAAAGTIRRAIKQMTRRGDLSENAPWQALEFWAAEYLAGLQEAVDAD